MVWTQALLWLLSGIIVGALFYNWLAKVGERHARVVSIGVCEDSGSPHLHITAVGVLEKAPLHAKAEVTSKGLKDPTPPFGFTEITWLLPITPLLRDSLLTCFTMALPARHPGHDYIQPFVVEAGGQRFVDIEMSRGGITLHVHADADSIDELIDELLASKEELLRASPTAEVEALVAPPK
jgi:hypothetical protein